MKIGIYGGSFDPIHSGHAMVANFISQCNLVDEVWLMVSKHNPLKEKKPKVSDNDRLRMAHLVAKNLKNVKVTDIEFSLPSPSYTYITLQALKRKYPDNEFKIIIGSDSLSNFPNWRNHEEILKEYGLIVYPRPNYPLPSEEPVGMKFLNGAPENSISSSLIREYINSGWNINYFVPISIADYIKKNKLYINE